MSDGYKLKMLVKAMWLASMFFLVGCASTLTSVRHVETVGGKDITYVVVKTGNSVMDHSMICDRYGPDGALLAHDTISNNGLLESLGGPLLNTLTPAVNAWQVLK